MRRFVRRSQWRTTSTGTGTCRSGTTAWSPPGRTTCVPGQPWTATSRRTSASSARATRGCGPRTPCWWPTLLCGSSSSRRRSPASVRADATAAGVRRSSPPPSTALAHRHGRESAVALRHAMNATVAEVGRTVAAEGIDANWRQGGTVVLARTPVQLARARAAVASDAGLRRRRRPGPARRRRGEAPGGSRRSAGRDLHAALRPGAPRRGWCAGSRGPSSAGAG